MNRITTGQVYVASRVFKGTAAERKYEIIGVVDERGKDEITIFVNDKFIPSGIEKGDRFRLNAITEVAHYWKKGLKWNPETKSKEEGWIENFNVNADVALLSSDLAGVDLSDADDLGGVLPWEDDGGLPL